MRPVPNLDGVLHAVPDLIELLAKCLNLDDLLALKYTSRSLRALLHHRDRIIAFSHIDLGTLRGYSSGLITRFAALTPFFATTFLSHLIEPWRIVSLDFRGAYLSFDALDCTLIDAPNLRSLSVRDVVGIGAFFHLSGILAKYFLIVVHPSGSPKARIRRPGNVLRRLEVKGFIPVMHPDPRLNILTRRELLAATTEVGIELDYQACIDCGSPNTQYDSQYDRGWAFEEAPCKGCGLVDKARCGRCSMLRPSKCFQCDGYVSPHQILHS